MASTLEHLTIQRALDLISDKTRWTRNAVTRTPAGERRRTPLSPEGIRYCAFGALVRAAYDSCGCAIMAGKVARSAERAIQHANHWEEETRLATINDTRGHAAIIRAFQKTLHPSS